MHSTVDQSTWTTPLPFVQLAHNTNFSETMYETQLFSMFERQPRLPVDVVLGTPHARRTYDIEKFAQNTRESLHSLLGSHAET